jgi:acyl-coenzyme A thioesterase PaaI-like protein
MTDVASLGAATLAAVPFVRTLGMEFVAMAEDGSSVTVRLPDAPQLHNFLGGPHAGALFSVAETASGAVVTAVFAEQFGRVTPLPVRAEIAFRKVARGTVHATARLGRPRDEILAELDSGARPEFPVQVDITRDDDAVVATLTVTWTLRPN